MDGESGDDGASAPRWVEWEEYEREEIGRGWRMKQEVDMRYTRT